MVCVCRAASYTTAEVDVHTNINPTEPCDVNNSPHSRCRLGSLTLYCCRRRITYNIMLYVVGMYNVVFIMATRGCVTLWIQCLLDIILFDMSGLEGTGRFLDSNV